MSHDEYEFDDKLATALFRITQESLTNVAKHAKAKQVEIQIFKTDNRVALTIQDDGIGMLDSYSKNGFGLIGMRERVRAFGGEFVLDSRPDCGTRIEVYIPLHAKLEQ